MFTPGPWHVGMKNGHNANIVYRDDDSIASVYGIPMHCSVEEVDDKYSNCLSNARLIAAAPEMYELLQKAHTRLLQFDVMSETHGNIPNQADLMTPIEQLLAKIEGR